MQQFHALHLKLSLGPSIYVISFDAIIYIVFILFKQLKYIVSIKSNKYFSNAIPFCTVKFI